jgi:hypothetical protein
MVQRVSSHVHGLSGRSINLWRALRVWMNYVEFEEFEGWRSLKAEDHGAMAQYKSFSCPSVFLFSFTGKSYG